MQRARRVPKGKGRPLSPMRMPKAPTGTFTSPGAPFFEELMREMEEEARSSNFAPEISRPVAPAQLMVQGPPSINVLPAAPAVASGSAVRSPAVGGRGGRGAGPRAPSRGREDPRPPLRRPLPRGHGPVDAELGTIRRGCFNCKGSHNLRDCTYPLRWMCHICGLDGVSKFTCPRESCRARLAEEMAERPVYRPRTPPLYRDHPNRRDQRGNYAGFL